MSVQILKGPLHGTATLKPGLTGNHSILGRPKFPNEQIRFESNARYTYESKPGFIGGDQIIFSVTLNNTQFRVKVNIVVKPGGFDNLREFDCESFEVTRVSAATSSAEYAFDVLSNEDASSLDLVQWQRSAQLSTLIANARQSVAGFTDLPSTALGQTIGEGVTATITLDTNAAGHGWYIDPTPLDSSDDYLPTSQAGVWQAKPDSAAAGKMDLLSVLLHEYGHALGLEHSGEAGDFMNASLQPGMRKLPSADELALMGRLVAQLKAEQGADALATDTAAHAPAETPEPFNPFGPNSPLQALSLLPIGFIRRGDKTSSSASALAGTAATPAKTHTDYLTAINPTLANGNFSQTSSGGLISQWETTGNVTASVQTVSGAVTSQLGQITLVSHHT